MSYIGILMMNDTAQNEVHGSPVSTVLLIDTFDNINKYTPSKFETIRVD